MEEHLMDAVNREITRANENGKSWGEIIADMEGIVANLKEEHGDED